MRHIFMYLLPWVIVFTLGWFAGDRYGAPAWATTVVDKGFAAVESVADNTLGGLFERVSEPVPGSGEPEAAGDDDPDDAAETADAPAGDSPAETEDGEPESSDTEDAAPAPGLEANAGLRLNEAGLQIIKDSEGLRLEPYEVGGERYVGYGHRITADAAATAITETDAEAFLRDDLADFERGVRAMLARPANENEFSAMVSLAHTMGLKRFAESQVLDSFNAGDKTAAAEDFRTHTGVNAPAPHLVERRERERMLFLKPVK